MKKEWEYIFIKGDGTPHKSFVEAESYEEAWDKAWDYMDSDVNEILMDSSQHGEEK